MPATLFVMDAANLFVGDSDPANSQYLRIKNIKMPSLQEQTMSHTGGGAAAGIDIGMSVMEPLMLGFDLLGFSPDVLSSFMEPGTGRKKYTVRGNVRDVRTHADIPVIAVVEGRMVKAEMSDFERTKGVDTAYEIKEVMFYELRIDGQEKFYFDYFAGPPGVRIDGVPIYQTRSTNLGLA